MARRCSVATCDTSIDQQCFDFPANVALQRKWYHFLKTCNGTVDTSTSARLELQICEKHFMPHEVMKGFSVTLLVPGAIPTIAVIRKNDLERIGTKPGVTIQPKIRQRDDNPSKTSQAATIVPVKPSKAISQVCKESGMCGSCLQVTGTPMNKISMAASIAFKEITNFETLSDLICDGCSVSLRNYIVFKSLVKRQHQQVRNDLEKTNYMTMQLDDRNFDDNGVDPRTKFNCNQQHEYVKHPGTDQQPFQKIQIQVADEDYDFMAQILNQNQLDQVKITENSPAASEENNSPFVISKVDSWATGEPGPSKPQATAVKRKRKKISALRPVDIDPLGDDFMPSSELIMQYPQNYQKLAEFVEDSGAPPKKTRRRNTAPRPKTRPQPHHRSLHEDHEELPFYCDLCGYSSSDRNEIMEHLNRDHPGTYNGIRSS